MNFDDVRTKGNYYLLFVFLIIGIFAIVLGFSPEMNIPYNFTQIGLGILIVIVAILGFFKERNPKEEDVTKG